MKIKSLAHAFFAASFALSTWASAATWVGTWDVDPQGIANAPAGPFTWSVECPDQDPAEPAGNTWGECYTKTSSKGRKKMVIECYRNGHKRSDEKDCIGNCTNTSCKSGEARAFCDCKYTTANPGFSVTHNVDCGSDLVQYNCAANDFNNGNGSYFLVSQCLLPNNTVTATKTSTINTAVTGASCTKRRVP